MNWLAQNWRQVPSIAWTGFCIFVQRGWKRAWGSEVPLAWHVAVVVAAALGTYYLSPILTAKFERQKIRSGYISANLVEMNKLVGDFYVAVMEASSVPEPQKDLEKFRTVDAVAARLSWKAVEIGAVLDSPSDKLLMQRFQEELRETQKSTVLAHTPKGHPIFAANVERFARTSVEVIQGVAQRADVANVPVVHPEKPPS